MFSVPPIQPRTRGSGPTKYSKRNSGRMLPDRLQRTLKNPSKPPQNWTWTTTSSVLKWSFRERATPNVEIGMNVDIRMKSSVHLLGTFQASDSEGRRVVLPTRKTE